MDKKKAKKERPNSRDTILEAALRTFSEHGFEGATTRDIAGAANVNHAMINYYFKNKEELWKQAVEYLFTKANQVLEYGATEFALLDGDPTRFFKTVIGRYIRFCAAYPEFSRIMMQEAVRDNDRLSWAVRTYGQQHHGQIVALLRMAQEFGLLPEGQLMPYAYMVVGAFHLPYARSPEVKLIWGQNVFSEEAVEEHINAVTSVFFDGAGRGLALGPKAPATTA